MTFPMDHTFSILIHSFSFSHTSLFLSDFLCLSPRISSPCLISTQISQPCFSSLPHICFLKPPSLRLSLSCNHSCHSENWMLACSPPISKLFFSSFTFQPVWNSPSVSPCPCPPHILYCFLILSDTDFSVLLSNLRIPLMHYFCFSRTLSLPLPYCFSAGRFCRLC